MEAADGVNSIDADQHKKEATDIANGSSTMAPAHGQKTGEIIHFQNAQACFFDACDKLRENRIKVQLANPTLNGTATFSERLTGYQAHKPQAGDLLIH